MPSLKENKTCALLEQYLNYLTVVKGRSTLTASCNGKTATITDVKRQDKSEPYAWNGGTITAILSKPELLH